MNARVALTEPIRPIGFDPCLKITVARSLDDLLQMAAIRAVVYMGEQQCPFDEEFDGNDFSGATHLIARYESRPVGVMRLRWFAEFAKIERFAVVRDHRGGDTARALFQAGYDLAARKGYRRVLGHIQARLAPFMRRVGGVTVRPGRPRFVFSDHEYVEVERILPPRADALGIDADPLVLLRPEGAWDWAGVLDRSTVRPATNPH
ncbi:MAG TPA: GNAT family N-acetyltransferase [Caulobacteraceae bacterium]|nr:GNAT family N-acetyltransferase [Caulobacteraceae bacterium]